MVTKEMKQNTEMTKEQVARQAVIKNVFKT